MIDAVDQLIDAYDAGAYVRDDLFNRILSLSSLYAIGDIIAMLPVPWREEFVLWARQMFDNAIPLSEFILISQGAPSEDDLRPIVRIREWFRAHE